MSNGYNLKDIAERYSKKTDSEIIYAATENAKGLKPGVLEIIEDEIKKRNLDPNILEGARAQNRKYSLAEITELSQKNQEFTLSIMRKQKAKTKWNSNAYCKKFYLILKF